MNKWDLSKLELDIKCGCKNKTDQLFATYIIYFINDVLIENNIELPEPIIEKDTEGSINISWFSQSTNKALYLCVEDKSLNYLNDLKHSSYSQLDQYTIIEVIKNFLE